MLSPGLGLEAVSGIPTRVCCDYRRCCPSPESAGRTSFSASEGVKIEASEVPLPWAAPLLAQVGGGGRVAGSGVDDVFCCRWFMRLWCLCGQQCRQMARNIREPDLGGRCAVFWGARLACPCDCTHLCCVHGLIVPVSFVVTLIIVMSTYCHENNTPCLGGGDGMGILENLRSSSELHGNGDFFF